MSEIDFRVLDPSTRRVKDVAVGLLDRGGAIPLGFTKEALDLLALMLGELVQPLGTAQVIERETPRHPLPHLVLARAIRDEEHEIVPIEAEVVS